MNRFCRIMRCAFAVSLIFLVTACDLRNSTPSSEEKDPHYLEGLNRLKGYDYKGAIAEFEKALETNPRSSAAHFRLGFLYEEHESDPAAAIYHFTRFLKLRPNAEEAKIVESHIVACKTELAKSGLYAPVMHNMQRDIERLNTENMELRRRLDEYQQAAFRGTVPAPLSGPAITPPPVSRPASNEAVRRPESSSPAPVIVRSNPPAATPVVLPPRSTSPSPASNPPVAVPRGPSTGMRIHKVRPGETPAAIARQYGIKLEALLKANPGLEPRRMKAGQGVNIPPS